MLLVWCSRIVCKYVATCKLSPRYKCPLLHQGGPSQVPSKCPPLHQAAAGQGPNKRPLPHQGGQANVCLHTKGLLARDQANIHFHTKGALAKDQANVHFYTKGAKRNSTSTSRGPWSWPGSQYTSAPTAEGIWAGVTATFQWGILASDLATNWEPGGSNKFAVTKKMSWS